jgi:hypothetical protein
MLMMSFWGFNLVERAGQEASPEWTGLALIPLAQVQNRDTVPSLRRLRKGLPDR